MISDYELRAPPPERTFRMPGCSDGCRVVRAFVVGVFGRSELMVHDPAAHEAYAKALVTRAVDVLRTGRLRLDRVSRLAWLDDRLLLLSMNETRLLFLLAARPDEIVTYEEIVESIWPDWRQLDWSFARTTISSTLGRLRARLRPGAAGLIATTKGDGLRLVVAPVGTSAVEYGPGALGERWSKEHARCVDCGTTARRHESRGRCTKCRQRQRDAARRGRS